MFNFVPKRSSAVRLLYGKRPFQRIQVGSTKHQVELPLSLVEKIYGSVDESISYHNGDYNPLKWKEFVALKVTGGHLYEAATCAEPPKTALTDLDWYQKICSIYSGHQSLGEVEIAEKTLKPKFSYPFQ